MTDTIRKMDLRDEFFGTVHEIARQDPNVIFMTADMGAWSLTKFREELPDQFMNVGISEQNMVSVAAGLALGGRRVFAYAIAPFLALRSLEQIKVDLCQMNLPVTLVAGGPGLTYASDGPTHHAIEDVSVMRSLPKMTIFNPGDPATAQASARLAYENSGPSYVRVDKGNQRILHGTGRGLSTGVLPLATGSDLLLIASGTIVHVVMEAADELRKQGIDTGVIDLFRVKPLDRDSLLNVIRSHRAIASVEEHTLLGGVGSAVCELLTDASVFSPLLRVGLPDEYCHRYGNREWLHRYYGLDVNGLTTRIASWFHRQTDGTTYARAG